MSGGRVGFGTEKGGAQVLKWKEDEKLWKDEFKDDNLIAGPVEDIALTGKYPNELLVVVGQGSRGTAVNIQSGGRKGELQMGHTKPLLSVAINGEAKDTHCIVVGEDAQVHSFRGAALKYDKSVQKVFG